MSERAWMFARYAALSLFAVPWVLVPMWLVISASLKSPAEAADLNLALPQVWYLAENYLTVLDRGNYFGALGNSLLVSLPTIAAVVLLGAAAAWGFGRSRSPLMHAGYLLIIMSILVPPSLLPSIYLLRSLNLDGTTFGYILVLIATRMGILVFLATGFIRSMPVDLEEAALIDGASRLQIFRIIILPLLAPVLFVGGIMLIIGVWSDFFFATFLLPKAGQATLPLALYSFATSSTQSFRWNLVFAHVILSSLPLIIMYFFVQRQVIGGLTEGAIKG